MAAAPARSSATEQGKECSKHMPPFYVQLPSRGAGLSMLPATATAAPGENSCAQAVNGFLIQM
jgi:hypothetical protein